MFCVNWADTVSRSSCLVDTVSRSSCSWAPVKEAHQPLAFFSFCLFSLVSGLAWASLSSLVCAPACTSCRVFWLKASNFTLDLAMWRVQLWIQLKSSECFKFFIFWDNFLGLKLKITFFNIYNKLQKKYLYSSIPNQLNWGKIESKTTASTLKIINFIDFKLKKFTKRFLQILILFWFGLVKNNHFGLKMQETGSNKDDFYIVKPHRAQRRTCWKAIFNSPARGIWIQISKLLKMC